MFEQEDLKHHIQRLIVEYLMLHEYGRFRDLRPKHVDTNLFTYHLKSLQKAGYVIKADGGYTLDRRGLIYVDRVTHGKMRLRTQPKIITMLLIQDGYGKVLLQMRTKQPYINTWTLPYGKIHIDDISVIEAAKRESHENSITNRATLCGTSEIVISMLRVMVVRSRARHWRTYFVSKLMISMRPIP